MQKSGFGKPHVAERVGLSSSIGTAEGERRVSLK